MRPTQISLVFALGVLIIAAGTPTAKASNLLTNGDFETGALSTWVPFVTANGLDDAADVVCFNTSGGGASIAARFNIGDASLTFQQEGGGISQSFALDTAGTYSFFANIASQDAVDGEINGDAGTYSILIDGRTIASDSLGGFATAQQIIMSTLSGTVVLGTGTHTFEVLVTRGYDAAGTTTPDEYVDNISLSAADSTAPEPRTVALTALALAGLALHRRQATTKQTRLGRMQ